MATDGRRLDRRQFLQTLGAGAWVAGIACGGKRASAGASPSAAHPVLAATARLNAAKPRVVVVRTKKSLRDGYDADRGAVRAMLEAGLLALSGEKTVGAAIGRYLNPGERVGLKINGLAGRRAATHVELVDELSVMLAKANIEGSRQIAFDRFARDLTASGFSLNPRAGSYRCVGNDQAGHEDEMTQMPSSASRLSRVLTTQVDGVINLPILKQHMLSGMTGALKNNFGCIHNPNKMHLDGCDPYIAEVNAIPAIRDKQRLVIMDALRPVLDNGPSYQPGSAAVANTMLFATDLVAVDTVALEILEGLRKKHELPPLAKVGLAPSYLVTAGKLGLGIADRAGIDVVSLEI